MFGIILIRFYVGYNQAEPVNAIAAHGVAHATAHPAAHPTAHAEATHATTTHIVNEAEHANVTRTTNEDNTKNSVTTHHTFETKRLTIYGIFERQKCIGDV